ncbi:MAG: glycosyltransferase family 4 protein [Candidatus Promineifilaceae bacterium]
MSRQTQLDALFFHTQVTAVLNRDWLNRYPSVISLDATPLQYDELGAFYSHETGPAWLERRKWQMNRDAFRAARHILAWTEWTKKGLVEGYEVKPEKVTVIPPGVDVAEWSRPQPRTLHDHPVKILFVGGNLERKGGLLLLEAFRALRPRYPIELHLVTKDSVAEEPGLFVYNNMQANSAPLKQLYFDSDIFCLPTYGDCLPMVLSEAGAAALPVISTRVAGIPEIVQEGETGFLVEAGDAAAITHTLETLITNPALRLAHGRQSHHPHRHPLRRPTKRHPPAHTPETGGKQNVKQPFQAVYRKPNLPFTRESHQTKEIIYREFSITQDFTK